MPMRSGMTFAAALLAPSAAFLVPSPAALRHPTPTSAAASLAALRMDASYTKKEDLLLDEEVDRSGVETDWKESSDREAKVDLAAAVEWSPSARGEPGKTPRDLAFGPLELGSYCTDPYKVMRRKTRTVTAGPVKIGSEHPLVRQTMTTTLTSDVEGSIEQIIACADEGFDLIRLTVVGMKDAKAMGEIRKGLDARGYDIPLCADMHFAPKVAIATAETVEKIRINPGNFVDGRKVRAPACRPVVPCSIRAGCGEAGASHDATMHGRHSRAPTRPECSAAGRALAYFRGASV